jgi:glycosyltransferase involved in cell wall biosynthesis
VGTDENVDKQLPRNILSIHRTQNQAELAQIYTAADLFVNPTREENFPTVQLESLACGTPILAFKTGGCMESITEHCGAVVDKDDIDGLEREIYRIFEQRPFTKEACIKKSAEYKKEDKFREYADLY